MELFATIIGDCIKKMYAKYKRSNQDKQKKYGK